MSVSCNATIDGLVVVEKPVATGLVPVGLWEYLVGDCREPFCSFIVLPDWSGTLGVEVA